MTKIRKYAKIADRNISKMKIIIGRAEDMRVSGVEQCGGVAGSHIKMLSDVNSLNIFQMMYLTMMLLKILKREKRKSE